MKKTSLFVMFVALSVLTSGGCVGYVGPDGRMTKVGVSQPQVTYRHEKTVTTRVWGGPPQGTYVWDNEPRHIRISRCPVCGSSYRSSGGHDCRRRDYNYGNINDRPDVHVHYHDDGYRGDYHNHH